MNLTNEQIEMAKKMHESGMTYYIIATYFKMSTNTLRRELKKDDSS